MQVTAKLRYLRIAPRKVRLVVDLVRGKTAENAQTTLSFTTKKAARPVLKLLNSAIASARQNFQQEAANLYISKITVDEGPKLKRWMPRARGQAYEIQKKTSHITVVLDEIKKRPTKAKKKPLKKEVVKAEGVEKIEDKKPEIKTSRPRPLKEMPRPEAQKGAKRMFRRKAF